MTMMVSTTLAAARTKALTRKIHSGALVDGFAGRSRWPDMGTKMGEIGEATEDRKTAVANRPSAASNQPAPIRSIPMNLKSTPEYWAVVASHITQANQPTRTASAARMAARRMAVLVASPAATRARTITQQAGFWKPKLTSVWTWDMPASQGEMRARNRLMTTRTPRGEANARRGSVTAKKFLGKGCVRWVWSWGSWLESGSWWRLFSHEIYLTPNRYSIQYEHAFCEWGEGELDLGAGVPRDQFHPGWARR